MVAEKGVVIGRYLKEARIKCGYVREQVAERANIGVRYLTAIENEEKKPRLDVFFRIIRALGISADKLAYPERYSDMEEAERLLNLFYTCTPQERKLITALIGTIIDNREQGKEE